MLYGKVFYSTCDAMYTRRQIPSIRHPDSLPFPKLWYSHLTILTQPGGVFDGVIDALIAIAQGDPSWETKRTADEISLAQSRMRDLLAHTPPNLVILDDFEHYGCRVRGSTTWNFICISKKFVDLWMHAEEDSEEKLALTAILITSVHHELAHWVQSIKAGFHLDVNDSDSSDGSNSSVDLAIVSNSEASQESTPKLLNASWVEGSEEAGIFVEVQTRGGIMQYHDSYRKAYLVVGPNGFSDCLFLSPSNLRVYLQDKGPKNSLFLHSPASESKSSQSYIRAKQYFPFNGVDNCQSPDFLMRPHHNLNYHGYTPTRILRL